MPSAWITLPKSRKFTFQRSILFERFNKNQNLERANQMTRNPNNASLTATLSTKTARRRVFCQVSVDKRNARRVDRRTNKNALRAGNFEHTPRRLGGRDID